MYTITELEDAIRTTLETGGLDAKIFHGDPKKGFPGEKLSSPVVFIMYERSEVSGFKSVQVGSTLFFFRLFVAVKNLKSATSAGRGDVSTTGIHQALESARALLEGSNLGLNIQPFRFLSAKTEIMPGRLAVGEQKWFSEVFE